MSLVDVDGLMAGKAISKSVQMQIQQQQCNTHNGWMMERWMMMIVVIDDDDDLCVLCLCLTKREELNLVFGWKQWMWFKRNIAYDIYLILRPLNICLLHQIGPN